MKMQTEEEFINNISFVVDTREQMPYQFEGRKSFVHGLPVGDYGLGNKNKNDNVELLSVSIERKTLDDFIGSVSKGRERFEKEIHTGKALDYFALVIEADCADIEKHNYRSDMNPKSAMSTIYSWSAKHRLPVWFCSDRVNGERITMTLLEFYAKSVYKKFKILKG